MLGRLSTQELSILDLSPLPTIKCLLLRRNPPRIGQRVQMIEPKPERFPLLHILLPLVQAPRLDPIDVVSLDAVAVDEHSAEGLLDGFPVLAIVSRQYPLHFIFVVYFL